MNQEKETVKIKYSFYAKKNPIKLGEKYASPFISKDQLGCVCHVLLLLLYSSQLYNWEHTVRKTQFLLYFDLNRVLLCSLSWSGIFHTHPQVQNIYITSKGSLTLPCSQSTSPTPRTPKSFLESFVSRNFRH